MKKELSDGYEISVDNMLDLLEDVKHFQSEPSQFFSDKTGSFEVKNILAYETKAERSQIFQMVDGKFILEVEGGNIDYYFSYNINDLI